MFKNKKLLVIAPHPDDDVLGCGGLISRVKRDGGKVYVMIIAVGDQKQYGSTSVVDVRIDETKKVMEFLKVDDYEICFSSNEKHLRLDVMPQKDLIDLIENESKVSLNKIKPDIVAIPHPNSNQDHRSVFEVAFTACRPRPAGDKAFQSIVISYEDSSSNWSTKKFEPNFYLDLGDLIDIKIQALEFYRSQVHNSPHYISIDAVRTLSHIRGIEIGKDFAEAFHVYRFLV